MLQNPLNWFPAAQRLDRFDKKHNHQFKPDLQIKQTTQITCHLSMNAPCSSRLSNCFLSSSSAPARPEYFSLSQAVCNILSSTTGENHHRMTFDISFSWDLCSQPPQPSPSRCIPGTWPAVLRQRQSCTEALKQQSRAKACNGSRVPSMPTEADTNSKGHGCWFQPIPHMRKLCRYQSGETTPLTSETHKIQHGDTPVKSAFCWSNPINIIVGAPLVISGWTTIEPPGDGSKPLRDERASLLAMNYTDLRNPSLSTGLSSIHNFGSPKN